MQPRAFLLFQFCWLTLILAVSLSAKAEIPPTAAILVNGQVIDEAQLERELRKPVYAVYFAALPQQRAAVRAAAQNRLIDRELLAQESVRQQLISPKDLEREVHQGLQRYGRQATSTRGPLPLVDDYAGLEIELRKKILGDYLARSISAKIEKVSRQELESEFTNRSEFYQPPTTAHLRHILLRVGAMDGEAVSARSIVLRQKLKSPLYSFETLAKEESQDTTAPRGGDLGEVSRGMMREEFDRVAFSLKPGEISEPFRTVDGILIVKMESRNAPTSVTVDSVSETMAHRLANRKVYGAIRDLLRSLRMRAHIEILK